MMDNIREKLVKLLKTEHQCPVASCSDCPYRNDEEYSCDSAAATADMLIDNGVTIQQWIPVSERLPEDEKPVLAYYGYNNDGDYGFAMMFMGTLSYFCFDPHPHWQHASTGLVVTHWMPLPQQPKGE